MWWSDFTMFDAQQAPPTWTVLATAAIALVAVASRLTWRVLRHVITIVHEGGHAGVAAMAGRRLAGVRLHSDTSGLTVTSGRADGPGLVLTYLAGYLAPPVLGLAAAAAVGAGYLRITLWVAILLLVALLVQIRNVFGVLSILITGALLVAVAGWAPSAVQGGVAYLLAWFLLVAGPRPVLELQTLRRRGLARASDVDQLANITPVAPVVWVAFLLLVTILALVLGAVWLLPGVDVPQP